MNYSLIFCSRKTDISQELKKNIEKTILTTYELIVVDNSKNNLSIFEAYNIGIDRSSGDFLVFLHDDILFHTIGWGEIIKKIFSINEDLGLLGIAGSTIKGRMPSTWWSGPGDNYIKILQHKNSTSTIIDREQGFKNDSFEEVAVIDGVFMVVKRDHKVKFDEGLKGFHNYDLIMSLKLHADNKRVGVTKEILIEHFSEGKIGKDWYISTSDFHKKYYKKLPVIKSKVSKEIIKNLEFTNGALFIIGLLDHNLLKDALYWWLKLFKVKFFAKFHLEVLKKLLLKFSLL